MIVFIPRSGDGCKPGDYDVDWLPRQCPACGQIAIIGHGRRRRQAHNVIQDWILVRRGLCKACSRTLTVLPGCCVPGSPYCLSVRRQTLDRLGQGFSAEQASPHCRDSNRLPDTATVRRWFWRRIESLRFFTLRPTLFAWDWRAASRILIAEPGSP